MYVQFRSTIINAPAASTKVEDKVTSKKKHGAHKSKSKFNTKERLFKNLSVNATPITDESSDYPSGAPTDSWPSMRDSRYNSIEYTLPSNIQTVSRANVFLDLLQRLEDRLENVAFMHCRFLRIITYRR